MFCQTEAPQARETRTAATYSGVRGPERTFLWPAATFQSSLGAARHSLAYNNFRIQKAVSQVIGIAAKLRTVVTINSCKIVYINVRKLMWGPPHFTEQGVVGIKSGQGLETLPSNALRAFQPIKRPFWRVNSNFWSSFLHVGGQSRWCPLPAVSWVEKVRDQKVAIFRQTACSCKFPMDEIIGA